MKNFITLITLLTISTLTFAQDIQMTSFNVDQSEEGTSFEWVLAEQVEVARFEIQMSADAKQFASISYVQADGNLDTAKEFNFSWAGTGFSGKTVYRIKTINYDGSFTYSDVITIDREEATQDDSFASINNSDQPIAAN